MIVAMVEMVVHLLLLHPLRLVAVERRRMLLLRPLLVVLARGSPLLVVLKGVSPLLVVLAEVSPLLVVLALVEGPV